MKTTTTALLLPGRNTRKQTILSLFVLLMALMMLSCKKETAVTPQITKETPGNAAVGSTLVVDTCTTYTSGSWEFGNKLYFSRNGKVTKLGCRMPMPGNYRVSLWDYTTENLIAATTVSVTDSVHFSYNSISPVDVTANTRYMLSINNTSSGVGLRYNLFFRKGILSPIYPFTSGSVTYENLQVKNSALSAFPDQIVPINQDYFAGVPDLQFEFAQ